MVKTDFKNTYEAFMHCDKNKLAKEFAAMYSDNEEQAAAVKEVDRAFARMETVTPKAVNPDEQSIIVVCKGFGDEGDDTVCIEVEDLRKWREEHLKESEPISDEMLTFMSTDEIENAVMKQDLPTKYAFELSAWNEILSWKLAPSSIYIYGLEFCLSRVLWEMTFFGVDASGKHQGCSGCHSSGSGQVFVSHVLSFSFVWIVFAQILQCSICCTTPIVSGSHIPASKQPLQIGNHSCSS